MRRARGKRSEEALVADAECGEDYILRPGADWAWIQVDTLVVRIRRDGEGGVIVEAFEDVEADPIATLEAAPGGTS
ncbi:MAG: hypothetical protein ACKVU1_04385 [bacterium]